MFFREMLASFGWLLLLCIVIPVTLAILPLVASLSLMVIVGSVVAMQRLVGLFNLRSLSIPAFFFWIYLAVILTPGFFVFNSEYSPTRWRFLFGIESVLVTVPVGIWFSNIVSGFQKKKTHEYYQGPTIAEALGRRSVLIYKITLSLGVLFVLINILETPVIPLFFLLRNPGEFLAAAVIREDSFKLLNSHFTYVYFVLRGTIFPFLILIAFGRYRQTGEKVWRRLFWISLLIGIFYATLTIEKSPSATIFGLLFVFFYLLKNGRLGKVASIMGPVLFLFFPAMVILVAYSGSREGTIAGLFQALGNRLFYSPAEIVNAYFEVFPAIVPFQHGASIATFAAVMGWQTVNIPNAVGLYMTQGTDLDTITANSCFLGNLNADFGLPGVVIGGIVAGYIMQACQVFICRKPKTITNMAAYALMMWSFGLLTISPLPYVLASGGVLFALILRRLFRPKLLSL